MSTTLNQAAYNVLNLMRGARSTNNEYISLEQVKYVIRYYRALIIRRDVNSGKRTEEFEQELQPVKMVQTVLTADNFPGNFPNVSGVTNVLKSTDTLPETIRIKDRDGITYIGGDSAVGSFQLMNYRAMPWQQYNKYTSGFRRAWTREDSLYISGWDIGSVPNVNVTVRGIFENPATAYDFRRLHQISVATIAGASGILSITIKGIEYSEAFNTNSDTTKDNFVSSHAAALLVLGITLTSSGTDEMTFTGDTSVNSFSIHDTSATMTATIVNSDILDPSYDDDLTPYPLPLDILQRVTQSLMNAEIKLLSETPNDEVLDALPTGQ